MYRTNVRTVLLGGSVLLMGVAGVLSACGSHLELLAPVGNGGGGESQGSSTDSSISSSTSSSTTTASHTTTSTTTNTGPFTPKPIPGEAVVTRTGCTPAGDASIPPMAPNGYYVNGNTICTPDGTPHLFHGVDRPTLEWQSTDSHMTKTDFKLMASWYANVVRIALNQDYWLPQSPSFASGYAKLVDQAIAWAEQAHLDVILDLHWSDKGDFANAAAQQKMADAHSIDFWKDVAARYKNDGRVFFELYNEPHNVSTDAWLNGGTVGGVAFVGMQALYDAVRSTGAQNLVIVGGLNWAYDLSFVSTQPVVGYNILYATHPYNNDASRYENTWAAKWGFLADTAPVIITEFGDMNATCDGQWDTDLLAYADKRNVSWTAWAWFPGGCKFPAIISDWNGTPTVQGAVVKSVLLNYDDPTPGPFPSAVDAGTPVVDDAGDSPLDAGNDGADAG